MMYAPIRAVLLLAVLAGATGAAAAAEETLDFDELVGTQWYGIYAFGRKAGYVRRTTERAELDGKPVVAERARMRLLTKVAGQKVLEQLHTDYVYAGAPPYELILVESESRTSTSTERRRIERDGEEFVVTHLLHGRTTTKRVPASTATLIDELTVERFVGCSPKPGETVRYVSFDSDMLKDVECSARLLEVVEEERDGETRRVFVVEVSRADSQHESRLLEDGTTVSATLGGTMTLRLEDEATACAMPDENEIFEVRRTIPIAGLDMDGEEIGTLTLAITGLPEGVLAASPRQRFERREDGVLVVTLTVTSVPAEASVTDEDRGRFSRFLESTDEIQADHERILRRARRIVGSRNEPVEQARRICRWVHRHVKSAAFSNYKTALDVLIHLEGDCTEHALLFVALCRASGLPAREVSGLVYSGPGERVFGMHRWAEVYVGEWVDVDPALGQLPADATHIVLETEGDRWFDLLAAFGDIRLEVLGVE